MKSLAFVLLLLLPIGKLEAQEVQVAFDSAGKMMTLDRADELRYHLFHDDSNFSEARVFLLPDSSYSVEITRESNGKTIRDRVHWSRSEKLQAEQAIERYISATPNVSVDQEGRTQFVTTAVLLSLIGYGTELPIAFNMSDGSAIAGMDLLMGGGSYLLAWGLTNNTEVTKNEASLAGWGGLLGLGHGWLLTYCIGGETADYHLGAAASTFVSIGEFLGGYYVARNLQMKEGTSSVIGYGGTFGALEGLGLSFMLLDTSGTFDKYLRTSTGLILAGSVGGYFAGYALTQDHPYTEGDATVLWMGTTLGGGIPLANMAANEVGTFVTVPLVSMAGSIGAAAALHSLTRNTNFTQAQALNIGLATAAGGLTLTGAALIGHANTPVTVALASVGSVGGFCLGFLMTPTNPRLGHKTGSLDFRINPTAYLMPSKRDRSEIAGLTYHF